MSRMLVVYLGSLMVRSITVAMLAAIGTWRMKNPAHRHAVWLAVLAVMMLLPAVDVVLPVAATPAPLTIVTMPAEPALSMTPVVPESAPAVTTPAAPDAPAGVNRDWWGVAAAVYLSIMSVLALQMALAHWKLRRIGQASHPIADRKFDPLPAQLRESVSVRIPVTVGFFRPVIILPGDWRRWDNWKLDAVLTHELAHVRRRDWAIAMLAAMNTVAFWYNPLSWWLERRIAGLCEEASDEATLAALADPVRYSEVLLQFAAVHAADPQPGAGVAMARRNIASRVERILENGHPGNGIVGRTGMAAVLALAIPVLCLAASMHTTPEAPSTIALRVPRPPALPAPSAPMAKMAKIAVKEKSQEAVGTLRGTIRGPGGAMAEDTKLTLSTLDGKEVRTAMTDRFGEVEMGEVPAGVYGLRIESGPKSVGGPFVAIVKADLTHSYSLKHTPDRGPWVILSFEIIPQEDEALNLSTAEPLRFEVASIKPNKSGVAPSPMGIGPVGPVSGPMGCHGTDRGPAPIALGHCVFKNVTAGFLTTVISILDEKEYKLGQVPDWVTSEGFDIEAKAEHPVTEKELGSMLVSLLIDRFNCSFRRETRQVSGFALTVANGGTRLAQSKSQEPQSMREAEASVSLLDDSTKRAVSPQRLSPARMVLMTGDQASMATLVTRISRFWTGPVVDRTNLPGLYDFELRWQPDDALAGTPVERFGPSFTTALEEQLGLRLEAQKVPLDFLVIDHIERPL
jgi:bla regulator protein blaR1